MASGSSSGISLNNSGFQRVNVVLPEPLAPAMKVNVARVTAMEQASFDARRESVASAFSRWRPRRVRLAPSFAPARSGSQPYVVHSHKLRILQSEKLSSYSDITCLISGPAERSEMGEGAFFRSSSCSSSHAPRYLAYFEVSHAGRRAMLACPRNACVGMM